MIRRVLRGAVAAVVTGLPVAFLALLVRDRFDPLISFDDTAIHAATDLTRAHPVLLDTLFLIQEVMQPRYVYLVGLAVCWLVWRHGLRSRAIWAAVTMVVGWNLGLLVKILVRRARPVVADPVSHAPGYSFPSGHAFNATLGITMMLIVAWPLLRSRPPALRVVLVAVGAFLVLLTCLNRVYLGVHFPSDVVAGVILALAMVAASWAAYRGPRQVAAQVAASTEKDRS
jgi:membrane-associated phospholipid phosphatase